MPELIQPIPPGPQLKHTFMNAGANTTSGSYVSTGIGMSVKLGRHLLLWFMGYIVWFTSTGANEARARIFFSTIGIPALGAAPDPSDLALGDEVIDNLATLNKHQAVPIEVSADVSVGFGVKSGDTVFLYVVFRSGDGLNDVKISNQDYSLFEF